LAVIEKEQKLVQIIRWAPPLIMLILMAVMMFMVLQTSQQQSQSELIALRTAVLEEQKSLLQAQVEQVIQQADYEQRSTETQLRRSIQGRIWEAYDIARNIYDEYADEGEAEVTDRIKAALRPIRFNQGRGYFFIYKVTGETILHPILPQNEGVNLIGIQDIRGDYIVRGMGEAVKAQGEAFYNWWFVKPNQQDQEFEKIGFGKYFEPYDWFIGTGEYIVDVEQDIQQRLLSRINNQSYANDGFVFVYDAQGNTLAHANPEWLGTNREAAIDENGKPYVSDLFSAANDGGGFVDYVTSYAPSEQQPGEKVSYAQTLPGWNWVIGAGVFTRQVDATLKVREQQLLDQMSMQQNRFLMLAFTATFLLTVGSWLIGRRIGSRFDAFQQRIESDFQKLERSRSHMEHMALHDQLTGLPNRARLHREIELGIKRSINEGKQLAILFVDLDDFKKINDAFGHLIGDKLLQKLGMRLSDLVETRGIVSRFGGDEFILCFPCLNNLGEAEKRVEEILNVFQGTFEIDGKVMTLSASIGVAMSPGDGTDPDELITKADIVLYKSKAQQKGEVLFYDQAINRQVQFDLKLERELRQALANDELYLTYQPQMHAHTHEIVGVEALLRWTNDDLGEVSPALFIPVAEETGMVQSIGRFVVKTALRDIAAMHKALGDHVVMSINISPKQLLESQFVTQIQDALAESDVKAEHVMLEITENVLINDLQKVLPILEALRATGFGISLDDFGTGYSSLSYLSALPLTEVKIDRTFVAKVQESQQSKSLVKAILAIAQAGQFHVVAEGVETVEQAKVLAAYGCKTLQGYYFDAPISLNKLISKYMKIEGRG
jgi:diguanylate cyclase (GGDEF)-like protein